MMGTPPPLETPRRPIHLTTWAGEYASLQPMTGAVRNGSETCFGYALRDGIPGAEGMKDGYGFLGAEDFGVRFCRVS